MLLEELKAISLLNKQNELMLKIFIPVGVVGGLIVGAGIVGLVWYGLYNLGIVRF